MVRPSSTHQPTLLNREPPPSTFRYSPMLTVNCQNQARNRTSSFPVYLTCPGKYKYWYSPPRYSPAKHNAAVYNSRLACLVVSIIENKLCTSVNLSKLIDKTRQTKSKDGQRRPQRRKHPFDPIPLHANQSNQFPSNNSFSSN